MFSEFGFLEYSVPPNYAEDVRFTLTDLGYTCIAEHVEGGVSVWQLNLSIIFVNEELGCAIPCLSGLGFICDQECINQLDAGYDELTDMYVTQDPAGYRVLMCPLNTYKQNKSLISDRYISNTRELNTTKSFEYSSGVVLGHVNDNVLDFYAKLGCKITKQGTNYLTMVTDNNRFSLIFSKTDSHRSAVVMDTQDVFHVTASFVNKQIPLNSFDFVAGDFGKLNYKINGYNCIAAGNKESYTIENSAPDVLPNLDFIFRQRKQYPHFAEETLTEHQS